MYCSCHFGFFIGPSARALHAEHKGSSDQVAVAKAARVQAPQHCTQVSQLWDALPAWKMLVRDVDAHPNYQVPDLLKAVELENMVSP